MLAGEVAQAKVLIIWERNQLVAAVDDDTRAQQVRNTRMVTSILRATGAREGADYRLIRNDQTKTEWLRTGDQVWNGGLVSGTPALGAYVEHFDAVISTYKHASISGQITGSARSDSLTLWNVQNRTGAAVPVLQLRDNSSQVCCGQQQWEVTASDSSGASGTESGLGYAKLIHFRGQDAPYWGASYMEGGINPYETGDLRRILTSDPMPFGYHFQRGSTDDDGGGAAACKWCDSMVVNSEADTLILWERQYDKNPNKVSTSGARTMVFASAWGGGSAIDSLGNADGTSWTPPTEGDWATILIGLARLDSLVRADTLNGVKRGGRVLGDKTIKIAPVVYGGLARGSRHSWKSPGSAQGIFPPDTSAFYAILDSLDALGIPITFAVNVDSADSYDRDIIKLKSVKNAHFTPQIWNGVADTAVAGGQDAKYRPVDVFGRWRPRTAVGDLSGLGADSSMAALLKSSLRMTDSIFGKNRVSRIAVAPDDDWSPENLRIPASGFANTSVDSIVLAIQAAGFHGVVANGQDPDARYTKLSSGPSANNPRGALWTQGFYTGGGIKDFKVLTHSGFSVMGGRAQRAAFADSVNNRPTNVADFWFTDLSRLWAGALLDFDYAYDTWAYDTGISAGDTIRSYDGIQLNRNDRVQAQAPTMRPVVKASVFRLSCGDLSGVPYGGPGGAPAANGYWVLKSAANAMRIINRLAGRTVIRFAYPDEIEP